MNKLQNAVRDTLCALSDGSLSECAEGLLRVLGYRSQRTIDFESVAEFLSMVGAKDRLSASQLATFDRWQAMDVIFQVTDDEVSGQGGLSAVGPSKARKFDDGIAKSFLFLAAELGPGRFSRSDLTASTRSVNRIFPMPTVVLFRHRTEDGQPLLTIGVVHRRAHESDPDRDVLERVTLVKDVNLAMPHRAHIDLISELALGTLVERRGAYNFDTLLEAWEAVLETGQLNRRFYRELFAWFQRATAECRFPDDGVGTGNEERHVIRLITRLLFVWFLKEKGLVPGKLFTKEFAEGELVGHSPNSTDYYRAVLQNLFFATLNTEIDRRAFSKRDQSTHRDFTRYRYRKLLRDPDAFLEMLKSVPFVDGGLFDCLDDFENVRRGGRRVDAFTDNIDDPKHGGGLSVPARLFFDADGLFPLFRRYKFTIEENTPLEEDVALDPELLGRAFENLLASYNPETRDTARKATGSYYTPRRVVEYMVDEALVAYLRGQVQAHDGNLNELEARLRSLVALRHSNDDGLGHPMHHDEVDSVIEAIDSMTILDPACGSGAFPMGILQKLVLMLSKVDPGNQRWKARQLDRARGILDPVTRSDAVAAVEKNFSPARGRGDFGRKLYLIQNVIHGVDVQPVACQIAKLRFFISLVIEQKPNDDPSDNYGIQALPNLETRFVAADSLIELNGSPQPSLPNVAVKSLEAELAQIRLDWFDARTRNEKWELKNKDERIRGRLKQALMDNHWDRETARRIADWDPYDQNACATWFDPEWMFGVRDGFDVVIGNPPYVQLQKSRGAMGRVYEDAGYSTFARRGDVYQLFQERGCGLLKPGKGLLALITSNSWLRADYGKSTRKFFVESHTPLRLVELGKDIFENAIVDSGILLLREGKHDDPCMTVDMDQLNVEDFPPDDRHWGRLRSCGTQPWVVLSATEQRLMDRVADIGVPLRKWDLAMNRGVVTGCNAAFIVDDQIRRRLVADHPTAAELLKPMLQGRDLRRWHASFSDRWLIYARRGTRIEGYPSVLKWMQEHERQLRSKSGANAWYELQASPGDEAHGRFRGEKLFWMDMTEQGRFAYSKDEMYCGDTVFMMSGVSLKYLCGVLNSRLIAWLMSRTAATTGMGLPRWKKYTVETIPVPRPSDEEERSIVGLVDHLIELVRDRGGNGDEEGVRLEHALDQAVFRLYGLDNDEVAAVARRLA